MSTPSDAPLGQPEHGPSGQPPASGPAPVPGPAATPGPAQAPAPGFGPPPGYAPAPGYGPPPGYGAPHPGYAPAPGYGPGYGQPAHPGVLFAPVQEYASPGGRQLAGPGERLLARIVDRLILSIPVLLLEIPLLIGIWIWAFNEFDLGADPNTTAGPDLDGGDVLLLLGLMFGAIALVSVVSGILSYLYEVVYMHRNGQTLGKRIMKLRVVRVEDGGPIDTRHARRRWLAQDGAELLGLIPFVGSLVGMYTWLDSLWLLWDKPNRQCLHDKYGKTAVVKLTEADLAKPAPAQELEQAA